MSNAKCCYQCPYRCIEPFNCHDVCSFHLEMKAGRDAARDARLKYLQDRKNVIKGVFKNYEHK